MHQLNCAPFHRAKADYNSVTLGSRGLQRKGENSALWVDCGSQQKSRRNVCHDKHVFVATQKYLVTSNVILSNDKRFVATETVFVAAPANCVIQHQPCPPYVSSLPVHIETYQFDQLFANLPIATTNPFSLSFLLSVHTVFPRSWFH